MLRRDDAIVALLVLAFVLLMAAGAADAKRRPAISRSLPGNVSAPMSLGSIETGM